MTIVAAHLEPVELVPGVHSVSVGPSSTSVRLTIAVPDPAPTSPVPLVLALHWWDPVDEHPGDSFLAALVEPGLRELGAIIVAPEAWGGSWVGAEKACTLASLVRAATEAWPVDPARRVVTGYSMGGVGTWYLVSLYPEMFNAAIPMAGEPSAVLTPEVPLLAIHGDQDAVFPLAATRQAVETLQGRIPRYPATPAPA